VHVGAAIQVHTFEPKTNQHCFLGNDEAEFIHRFRGDEIAKNEADGREDEDQPKVEVPP